MGKRDQVGSKPKDQTHQPIYALPWGIIYGSNEVRGGDTLFTMSRAYYMSEAGLA